MTYLPSLLPQYGFRTRVFFQGEFCSQNFFADDEPVGYLHLVKKGRVIMEHEGSPNLEVTVPSLVIYPRSFPHRLVVPAEPAELICAAISFTHPHRNPLADSLSPYLSVPLQELSCLAPVMQILIDEAAAEYEGKQEVLDRLCDILLIQLFRFRQRGLMSTTNPLGRLPDARIASVISAMHASPAQAWTIEAMASRASMSRSSFAKRFHDAVGMPPAYYLMQMRLALAADYLRQNHSVKQAALAVGYRSQPAFTKAFSGKYGMAPLKWLAAQRQSSPV